MNLPTQAIRCKMLSVWCNDKEYTCYILKSGQLKHRQIIKQTGLKLTELNKWNIKRTLFAGFFSLHFFVKHMVRM